MTITAIESKIEPKEISSIKDLEESLGKVVMLDYRGCGVHALFEEIRGEKSEKEYHFIGSGSNTRRYIVKPNDISLVGGEVIVNKQVRED